MMMCTQEWLMPALNEDKADRHENVAASHGKNDVAEDERTRAIREFARRMDKVMLGLSNWARKTRLKEGDQ